MFAPLGVPDPQALALDDHARIDRLILLVLRKMVPDVGAIRLDDGGNVLMAITVCAVTDVKANRGA
jgi:hypothetical protein